MPYARGDQVIPVGDVPHSREHGVIVGTTTCGRERCLVQFEDGVQVEYDADVLTLTRWWFEDAEGKDDPLWYWRPRKTHFIIMEPEESNNDSHEFF
jgi:hypothetical protein